LAARSGEVVVGKACVVVLLSLLMAAPALGQVRIKGSPGGRIGDYLTAFALVRQSGQPVIIDGPCLSACTLVLSVVPRTRICVTPRAALGFHAAWTPGRGGEVSTHAEATRMMMSMYPPPVRAWIRRKGGLTRRMIVLRGRELASLYRPCR
jgi:hypothetical protein